MSGFITGSELATFKNQESKKLANIVNRMYNYISSSTDTSSNSSTIYVSNNGDSNNNGLTTSTPITLEKLLTLTLEEEQVVSFNRGEIFSNFGLIDVKISIKSYGSGSLPILYGSTPIDTAIWTLESGNIYSTPVTSNFKWLYKNDVEANLTETGWYVITSQPSSTKIRATTLINAWGSSIVGAKIVVKEYYFAYSQLMTVIAYNNTTGEITLSDPIQTSRTGYYFKLFDQQQFLSTDEFWFNSINNKLYYQTSGGAPNSTTWRYCIKDTAILLDDNVNDITIQDVDIRQYYRSAIEGKDNNRINILNNNISLIRQNGIFLYGEQVGNNINYNTITYCGQNGIYLGGLTDFNINYNDINNIGLQNTLTFILKMGSSIFSWEQSTGCGICYTRDLTTSNVNVLRSIVKYNSINNVAYNGFSGLGSYNLIEHNEIHDCLLKFYDGSGIYFIKVFGYDPICDYNEIRNNIIYNITGTQEYTPGLFNNNVYGIYLDSNSSNNIVDGNVIEKITGACINSNYGGFNNTYTNNILVDSLIGILFHNNATGSYAANVGNILTENIFAMRTSLQIAVLTEDYNGNTSYNPYSGGESNRNYYINIYGSTSLFAYSSSVGGARTSQTITQWRTKFSQDVDSKVSSISISYSNSTNALSEVQLLLNRNNYTIKSFSKSNYVNIKEETNYIETIPPFSGAIILKTVSSGNTSITDNFTGTNGTNITAHTPDTGGTWVLHSGATTLNGSGFLTGGASGASDITQNLINYDVTITLVGKITSGSSGLDIIARHNGVSTGFNNETFTWVAWYSGTLGLYSRTAGVTTTLQTVAVTQTVSTSYTVTLILSGDNAIVQVGGVEKLNYTGLTLNLTSTRHGLRIAANGGALVDSITITNP